MMKTLLLIGAGSFAGGVLRYLMTRWADRIPALPFPFGTFAVNIIGCLVIGAVFALAGKSGTFDSNIRLALTAGFCGGFTTFSTFMNENFIMAGNGQFAGAAAYTVASLVTGFAAIWLGRFIVSLFL